MMNSSKIFGHKSILIAMSALALSGSGSAFAATASDNLAVSATVIDNCLISTSALGFGNYDPVDVNASANLDGTGTVSVTCTLDDVVQITLDDGVNADTGSTDTVPLRRLTDGTNFLSYSLFSDAGRTAIWGIGATVDVETTGTGANEDHTVYGRVASGQNRPAGAYADTVQATVTF
jgi:spore coat protein U-like protein